MRKIYIWNSKKEKGEGYFDIFKYGVRPIGKRGYKIGKIIIIAILLIFTYLLLIGNLLSTVVIHEDGRIELIDPDLFISIQISKEDIVKVVWIQDINNAGELTPKLRLFGIATDSFHDGWFLLCGGKNISNGLQ